MVLVTTSLGILHICSSNFGAQLVTCSRQNLRTAQDVLAAGLPPITTMETIVVTLIHIALYSDKIELEV